MKRLLAFGTALTTIGAAGCFGLGIATADEPPVVPPAPGTPTDDPAPLGTPGRGYALGGAHVLGIPYDEYINRTGADWFPGLDRQIVDYPAGQVQGHTLERLFPGIGRLDDEIMPGMGLDGPSVGRVGRRRSAEPHQCDPRGRPRHRARAVRGCDGAQRGPGATRVRSRRPAAGPVELRDVRRPGGAARLR